MRAVPIASVCDTKSVYKIEGKPATRNNAAVPFNANTNMGKSKAKVRMENETESKMKIQSKDTQ